MTRAAELYAKRQRLGEEAEGYAYRIKIEALARLGDLLLDMPKAKGTKGQLAGRGVIGGTRAEPPINDAPTLATLGISERLFREATTAPHGGDRKTEAVQNKSDNITVDVQDGRGTGRAYLLDRLYRQARPLYEREVTP